MIIFRRKSTGVAILELSSSGVKLTIGPSHSSKFIPGQWRVYKTKTKTGREGIKGTRMDLGFFRDRVLPVIEEYLLKASGYEVICIATAWAREITNLPQVEALLPEGLSLRVLTAQEEAESSAEAFKRATKKPLSEYQEVLLIDSGSLSTEVISVLTGKSVSLREKEPLTSRKKLLGSVFGYVKDLRKVLLVSTENLWNPMTGEPGWNTNDMIYPPEHLMKRSDLAWIVQDLGGWPVIINGATLGIGYAYREGM